MATLNEMLVFVQFFGLLAIICATFYNVVSWGKYEKTKDNNKGMWYDQSMAWLLLIVYIILNALGIVAGLIEYENTLITQLMFLESYLFGLFVLLWLIQYALYVANIVKKRMAYRTQKDG